MKKQYTRKQIQEAIDYWKKQLNTTKFELTVPDGIGNKSIAFLTPDVMQNVFQINPKECGIMFKINGGYSNPILFVSLEQYPTGGDSSAIILDENDTEDERACGCFKYPEFYKIISGIQEPNSFIIKTKRDEYYGAEKITIVNNGHNKPCLFFEIDTDTDRIL